MVGKRLSSILLCFALSLTFVPNVSADTFSFAPDDRENPKPFVSSFDFGPRETFGDEFFPAAGDETEFFTFDGAVFGVLEEGDLSAAETYELMEDLHFPEEEYWPLTGLEQEYLLLAAGESARIVPKTGHMCEDPGIRWDVVPGGENVVSVDPDGTVTAIGKGTAAVQASASGIFGGEYREFSAVCRIDVVEDPGDDPPVVHYTTGIYGVSVPVPKATVELYRTDYTRISVILHLRQNGSHLAADNSDLAVAQGEPDPGTGAAIENARFSDSSVNALFYLRVADDRNLEIIPRDSTVQSALKKPSSVKSLYKSEIELTVGGVKVTVPAVSLTVKKTLPSVKAKMITLNRKIPGDTAEFVFTGGTVTAAEPDTSKPMPVPHNMSLRNGNFAVCLDSEKAVSGKIYLKLAIKGWAVRQRIAVPITVKNAQPALKLVLKGTLSTISANSYATVTVSFGNVFNQIPDSICPKLLMTDRKCKEYFDASGYFSCTQTGFGNYRVSLLGDVVPSKDFTYYFSVSAFVPGYGEIESKIRIPLTYGKPSSTVTAALKVSGAIDVLHPESTEILLIPVITNYFSYEPDPEDLLFYETAKGKKRLLPAEELPFEICTEGEGFLVRAIPGSVLHTSKYTAVLNVPGTGKKSPSVPLSVIMSKPVIAADPAKGTLYTDDKYSSVRFTLSAEGLPQERIRAVIPDAASAKNFDLIQTQTGMYEIRFKNNTVNLPGAASRKVILSVFLSGNNSSTPNAKISVSIDVKPGGQSSFLELDCSHTVHSTNGICVRCGKHVPHTYANGICTVCGKATGFTTEKFNSSLFASCPEKGTVTAVSYPTFNYAKTPAAPAVKKMLVYLPHGYTPEAQYNVLILIPGYTGNENSFLNGVFPFGGKKVKISNLLDNLIYDGMLKPTIAVSIAWGAKSGTAGLQWNWDNDVKQMAAELRNDILPFIASHYATYAPNDSTAGLSAARDHTAVLGFSYGAELIYGAAIPECFDLFSFYAPISDPSVSWYNAYGLHPGFDADISAQKIASSPLPIRYFYVGAGDSDIANQSSQNKYHDFTENCGQKITDGVNGTFISAKGCGHEMASAAIALYNCSQVFF